MSDSLGSLSAEVEWARQQNFFKRVVFVKFPLPVTYFLLKIIFQTPKGHIFQYLFVLIVRVLKQKERFPYPFLPLHHPILLHDSYRALPHYYTSRKYVRAIRRPAFKSRKSHVRISSHCGLFVSGERLDPRQSDRRMYTADRCSVETIF